MYHKIDFKEYERNKSSTIRVEDTHYITDEDANQLIHNDKNMFTTYTKIEINTDEFDTFAEQPLQTKSDNIKSKSKSRERSAKVSKSNSKVRNRKQFLNKTNTPDIMAPGKLGFNN